MSTRSGELQVIRRFSSSFKVDNNLGSSNGPNLVPIPAAYVRDARYQGDAQVKLTPHKVASSSQDQRKQPLVDCGLSAINPDASQPSNTLSNLVVKTTNSHRSLSSIDIVPVLPTQNSATFLADRVSSTVNTAGDQLATPAVQYPPLPPGPVSSHRPRPAGFFAIPATARARGDSVNYMSAEDVSGAREARERVQIGDAKTVLIFNGVFIPIVASFIMEGYKLLSPNIGQKNSPPPAASIVIVNVLWLISLVLNITLTLFATSTLMEQWRRGYTQQPQVPRMSRDQMHSRSYLLLCTLSVFLFLAGLVIFFFTIHKIVGIVVLIVSIAVGLFGMFYLALRPHLYRTFLPLSYSTI